MVYIYTVYIIKGGDFLENKDSFIIQPIAYIKNGYKEKFGIPRQSRLAPSIKSVIEFCEDFRDENCIRDIQQYSHLWLIWGFSKNENQWSPTVRPPRLGGNKRVGVFATRSPFRPNPIGLSCVKFEKVEDSKNGKVLVVSGGDLADGTPIYDIKPYLPYVDSIPDALGGFSEEHKDHILKVDFPEEMQGSLTKKQIENIIELLSLDPRPSYQNDEERIYGFAFEDLQINFKYKDEKIIVVDVLRG